MNERLKTINCLSLSKAIIIGENSFEMRIARPAALQKWDSPQTGHLHQLKTYWYVFEICVPFDPPASRLRRTSNRKANFLHWIALKTFWPKILFFYRRTVGLRDWEIWSLVSRIKIGVHTTYIKNIVIVDTNRWVNGHPLIS